VGIQLTPGKEIVYQPLNEADGDGNIGGGVMGHLGGDVDGAWVFKTDIDVGPPCEESIRDKDDEVGPCFAPGDGFPEAAYIKI